MNLYKRCKNIFKSHGVDIGGGGGGSAFDFVIKVTADETTLSKGDYNSIKSKLINCEPVFGALAIHMGVMFQTGIFKNVLTDGNIISCMVDDATSYTIAADNIVTEAE